MRDPGPGRLLIGRRPSPGRCSPQERGGRGRGPRGSPSHVRTSAGRVAPGRSPHLGRARTRSVPVPGAKPGLPFPAGLVPSLISRPLQKGTLGPKLLAGTRKPEAGAPGGQEREILPGTRRHCRPRSLGSARILACIPVDGPRVRNEVQGTPSTSRTFPPAPSRPTGHHLPPAASRASVTTALALPAWAAL